MKKRMKFQVCTNPACKEERLTILDENADPMILVCEKCGKKTQSLKRFVLFA